MPLRSEDTIQRALISTTSRLYGEWERSEAYVGHAWNFGSMQVRWQAGPSSRSAFVFSFVTAPLERAVGAVLPNYGPIGAAMSNMLAVLYGKRFDFHGLIEGSGHFQLPDLSAFNQLCNPQLPQNSHESRVDFNVPLNLVEIARVEALALFEPSVSEDVANVFHGAAKFYAQALQTVERDPEVAYLHLITAIEILSGHFDYPKESLWDTELRDLIDTVRGGLGDDGERVAQALGQRLRQVKKAFVRTVLDLVDPGFFDRTEAVDAYRRFKLENFEQAIKAAYDLRSQYVHTGVPFGRWVDFPGGETSVGKPVLPSKELVKVLERAPTYQGLERVVRYCLLRFLEINGAYKAPEIVPTSGAAQSAP